MAVLSESIGATYVGNGCDFKVWAPNAEKVQVAGDFNIQDMNQNGGYWDVYVPNVRPGQKYYYNILNKHTGKVSKLVDPAARDTVNSSLDINENQGIIVDTSYNWAAYNTPAFENFIIYQLHVGTFAGFNDDFNKDKATLRDIESKLQYIADMNFDAIELLPVAEFHGDAYMGYDSSFYFTPESSYGSPFDLRYFVDEAHKKGLAVIFDVVYNHPATTDNSLWDYDGEPADDGGIYLKMYKTQWTKWGDYVPEFWKREVKNFFLQNAKMYFEEYHADGIRFDSTRAIDSVQGEGWAFLQYLTWCIKEKYPNKYLIAEHLPAHESIITGAGFNATWTEAHHHFQKAASGDTPIDNVMAAIDWNTPENRPGSGYPNQWNNIKYFTGSHDDIHGGKNGVAEIESPMSDWEKWNKQHRYFVELFGGRDNWHARAKARMGWALNIASPGTPMMFMGTECHHWGYWNDERDDYGDHRFNWSIAGDPTGMPMRNLVTACNRIRWENPCLRSENFSHVHFDYDNNVMAFKRWINNGNNCVLTIINLSETNFENYSYGVRTGGQGGRWTQILCTQDEGFGGWKNSGNAFYEPETQPDGMIYINLPKWSVVMMRLL